MEAVIAGLKFGAMIGAGFVGLVASIVLGVMLLIIVARLFGELL
jgi:hypothetical protein